MARSFREITTGSHTAAAELWVCDSALAPLERVPFDAGTSLAVGTNLVRRSGQIVLDNADGRYTPGAGAVNFDRPFLLRHGVVDDDGLWLWNEQPLLWIDEDETDVGAHTVTLGVSDGMRIVTAESQLASPVSFPSGASVAELVRAALVACGAPDDDAFFDLADGGALLSGDHGYEAGARWGDVLNQVLVDFSLDLWAAAPLVYTLRPIPDPLTAPIVATWALGSAVRILASRRRRKSLARNHAIVSGLSLDGVPVQAEVFDRDPASPVAFGKPGVGDLPIGYHSDSLTTIAQCADVGASLLVQRSDQVTFVVDVPFDPSLERRDVVQYGDYRLMLDSFPILSGPGAQQVSAQLARSLA